MDILKTPHLQCTRNKHHTRTVNRSINNLHIFLVSDSFRIDRNGFNLFQIRFINVFADNLNQTGSRITPEFNVGSRSYLIHFIDNSFIMRCQYLCTIIPISLVTVIFFRIMRSCQNNTALTTEVTDSKRHFRSRAHIFEQIYFDTVSSKNICGNFCKKITVVAAVVSYHYGNLRNIFKISIQIVGKPLSGSPYRIDIHAIGTYTHDTAQTACTEFQIFIESFYQLGFIFICQHTFHFSLSFGIICRGKPFFSFLSHLLDEFLIFHLDCYLLVNDSLISISHKCKRIK